MDTQSLLLQAIHAAPSDDLAWHALADFLEEQGQLARAELLRLDLALRRAPAGPERDADQHRLQELLLAGVAPCVPTLTQIGMTFALIPAGTFLMGSPPGEAGRDSDEGPQHRVTLTRPFYLGTHEVTQAQWQAVLHGNPSKFKGPDRPVENVSWHECQDFCRRLEQRDGRLYRLPTEAEWEYACRAGTTTPFAFGTSLSTKIANFAANEDEATEGATEHRRETVPVGSFLPNAWGLYDMHGNVREWCLDWLAPYRGGDVTNPHGPNFGSNRVLRGGSWIIAAKSCRSAHRHALEPDARRDFLGFRVLMEWGGTGP
jgi:uncharacterized protein (TIGR02996 family)